VNPLPIQVDVATVLPLLEREPLRHLVTLKMINSYAGAMSFLLQRDGKHWAVLSLLPTQASDWDRKAYPDTRHIALVDGTHVEACDTLFRALPAGPIVVKSGDEHIQAYLEDTFDASKVSSYISFTAPTGWDAKPVPEASARTDRDVEAWSFFAHNGYEPTELERYFAHGGNWFGSEANGELASACFVLQNYGKVWEIAGVYTKPDCRRRGLARRVVASAVSFLVCRGLIARYQAKWDNFASIRLARESGLIEFLRVNHYRIPGGSYGDHITNRWS